MRFSPTPSIAKPLLASVLPGIAGTGTGSDVDDHFDGRLCRLIDRIAQDHARQGDHIQAHFDQRAYRRH